MKGQWMRRENCVQKPAGAQERVRLPLKMCLHREMNIVVRTLSIQ